MNGIIRSAGTAGLIIVAGASFGTILGHLAPAGALPACGGNNAAPHAVPYDCIAGPKVIDGTTFSALVHADGTHVTVTIGLLTARTVDTPIRIIHHEGKSGAGGVENGADGVIPAGARTAVLVDSAPCRVGQLDVKAVFIGPGDEAGRIGGPWIDNSPTGGCTTGDTTTTTTVPVSSTTVPPVTTTPTTSRPGSSTSTTKPAPTGPSTTGGTSVAHATALPATGGAPLPALGLALGMLAGGAGLVVASRRRAS
jgi:hypothetical protein